MRVEKKEGNQERRILIGMITDPIVLSRISSQWNGEGLFQNQWSNLIAGWCIRHLERYNKAPVQKIESLFERWRDHKERDPKTVELIERFLGTLSGQYEQEKPDTPEYLIDLAGEHFNKVRVEKLAEQLQDCSYAGETTKAQELILNHNPVEIGVGGWIDVLRDKGAMQSAVAEQAEVLIQYPGALGKFIGNSLCRDGFISFLAPEKRGKSFWLIDVAWRSMLQRNKTAFFAVGDMTQNQMLKRFMTRAANRPWKAGKWKTPSEITRDKGDRFAQLNFNHYEVETNLSWQASMKACQKLIQKKLKTDEEYLRLSVHPNSSISAVGIRSQLEIWARMGWVPDVIVIDYADILAPPPGYKESRDQINATWKQLRSMSQSLHCLIVTATQANAAAYSAKRMDMKNFSEDKRKFAHVTGMIGLNQEDEEKKVQTMRLNWIVLREEEYYVARTVHVAGCLAVANPAIKSCF